MKLTELITNTALLGTAKKQLDITLLPDELRPLLSEIAEKENNAEAAFFKQTAFIHAFLQAGMLPETRVEVEVPEAPKEEHSYLSEEVTDLVVELAENGRDKFLMYCYRRLANQSSILRPYALPILLQRAYVGQGKGEERLLLDIIGGRRGRWLKSFMQLSDNRQDDDLSWDTATHAVRVAMLSDMRRKRPADAIALLQEGLSAEPANRRADFICALEIGLTIDDEPFLLATLQSDKSKVVKEHIVRLLQRLPDSQFVRMCERLLAGKLHYNRIFGWRYDEIEYTSELKQWGFQQISDVKGESDNEYLLRQLAERVPLRFWAEFYGTDEQMAACRLADNPPFKKNLFALSETIARFRHADWAYETIRTKSRYATEELIALLSVDQREEVRIPDNMARHYVPDCWLDEQVVWGKQFSKWMVERSRNWYYVSEEVVLKLHPSVLDLLENQNRDDKWDALVYLRKKIDRTIDHLTEQ